MNLPTILRDRIAKSESDARHFVPETQPRLCKCCGETGEFDLLFDEYPLAHQAAVEAIHGGKCCTFCLDQYENCDNCGTLTAERDPIYGYCPDCDRAMKYGRSI